MKWIQENKDRLVSIGECGLDYSPHVLGERPSTSTDHPQANSMSCIHLGHKGIIDQLPKTHKDIVNTSIETYHKVIVNSSTSTSKLHTTSTKNQRIADLINQPLKSFSKTELKDCQKQIFMDHVQLSKEFDLPLNVHSRNTGHYTIDVMMVNEQSCMRLMAKNSMCAAGLKLDSISLFHPV
jgi:hypothetical protein